jgi:glycosyltransferase involved in cell wall biosynthesis
MKAARYLLFTSQCYENFPMVIAEAFACGLPVIASKLGAASEIVEHGRTGLLVAPGEATDLAEAADLLWANPITSLQMGREARAEYEAKYCAQRSYSHLRQIYESVLG